MSGRRVACGGLVPVVTLWTAATAGAVTAYWSNTAGGSWSTAGNWLDSLKPGPGTNVDINANGTYTTTANFAGVAVSNVAVGTASASGVQTLDIGNSALAAADITVGLRGRLRNGDNGNINGSGTVTLQSGANGFKDGSSGGTIGNHNLVVEGGASWTIGDGATDKFTQDTSANTTFTINGVADGAGILENNELTYRVLMTGTGQVNVAKWTLNNNNGRVFLGGSLKIKSLFDHGTGANNRSILMNGADITFGGRYISTNTSSGAQYFLVDTNTSSATVRGTNEIRIVQQGSTGRFTGAHTGSDGGTVTFEGPGPLYLRTEGSGIIQLRATTVNLRRPTTLTSDGGSGYIRKEAGAAIVVAGTNTLTIGTNAVLHVPDQTRVLKITSGATLKMDGGRLRGTSNDTADRWNVQVGRGSRATLAISSATNSVFFRDPAASNPMRVLLGSNAVVTAAAGGVLNLQRTRLYVAMTNAADWGLKGAGTLAFGDTNIVEALTSDRGTNVVLSAMPFAVNRMAVLTNANFALTLWNQGHVDNDRDGTNDAALYVGTLDLTGMQSGRSLSLAGSGIAAPRLYYSALTNPNGATLGAGVLKLAPQTATVSCTITNSPIPSGAQWRLTSGPDTAWKSSGASITLPPATYTQTFKQVQFFLKPADRAVVAAAGATTNPAVGYATNANWGAVSAVIEPEAARTAGAQWHLTGGPQTNWQSSGASVQGLETGAYTLTYKPGSRLGMRRPTAR